MPALIELESTFKGDGVSLAPSLGKQDRLPIVWLLGRKGSIGFINCCWGVRFSDGFARDVEVLDFGRRVFAGKGSDVEVLFGLMIWQRRCWQAVVLGNFRYAFVEHQRGHDLQVVDCKEVKSLIEAVALEGIRKMKVVEAF